mmetsp:Transcript_215/g.432  ORF Transcript_215/g.432 Transcript_215/m.432 type:complete len:452 (+) Transcript_215:231-1586(+)
MFGDDITRKFEYRYDEDYAKHFRQESRGSQRDQGVQAIRAYPKPVKTNKTIEKKTCVPENPVKKEHVDNKNRESTLRTSYVTWTEEEDKKLMALVDAVLESTLFANPSESHETLLVQTKFWQEVAREINGRSSKQCRERWKNSLDPNICHTVWKLEEDLKLLALHDEMGNKWSAIASALPGRTENGVKTRFKSIERARKRQWTDEEDNKLIKLQKVHGAKWKEIHRVMPTRSIHALKMRYRALISENVKNKSREEGSPYQCLAYDFKTYFNDKKVKDEDRASSPALSGTDADDEDLVDLNEFPVTKRSNTVTKKRDLIDALLVEDDTPQLQYPCEPKQEGDFDLCMGEEFPRKRRCSSIYEPCIFPGFTLLDAPNLKSEYSDFDEKKDNVDYLTQPYHGDHSIEYMMQKGAANMIGMPQDNPEIGLGDELEDFDSVLDIISDACGPCSISF